MHFGETKTAGGIILTDDDGTESGIHPRWAKVYAVGKEQDDVRVGQWLLIAHGRWSRALKVKKDGVELEVRMIDENDILLVSDDEPEQNRLKAGYVNTGGMRQMTSLPGND
jgi:co-chaperonin GroES (HSP10)